LPAAFCAKGDCVISNVFDQSHCGGKCPPPAGNHLGQRHKLVNASQHKISVGGGTEVYGMWFDPGYGYHVDNTTNIATGNEPESIYAVLSGTHFNGGCCFDVCPSLPLRSHTLPPLISRVRRGSTATPRMTTTTMAAARWKRSTLATPTGTGAPARSPTLRTKAPGSVPISSRACTVRTTARPCRFFQQPCLKKLLCICRWWRCRHAEEQPEPAAAARVRHDLPARPHRRLHAERRRRHRRQARHDV